MNGFKGKGQAETSRPLPYPLFGVTAMHLVWQLLIIMLALLIYGYAESFAPSFFKPV